MKAIIIIIILVFFFFDTQTNMTGRQKQAIAYKLLTLIVHDEYVLTGLKNTKSKIYQRHLHEGLHLQSCAK